MVNNYRRTYTGDDSDITPTISATSTTMNDGGYTFSIRCNCNEETKVFNEGKYLKQLSIEAIEEIREGWLKPHKQLKPVKSYSKKNILPKIRTREKKQIFIQAA